MKRKREHEIQQECILYLIRTGWLVLRLNSGGNGKLSWVRWWSGSTSGSAAGASDLLALKDGKFLAIEVKSSSGELSEAQKSFLGSATAHGATICVVNDLEVLIEALRASYETRQK